MYNIRSLIFLFIVSQLSLVVAIILIKQEVVIFGELSGLIALFINSFLFVLVWKKLIYPLKELLDTKINHNSDNNHSVSAIAAGIGGIILSLENTNKANLKSFEKDHELINIIEEEIKSLSSYSEYLISIDDDQKLETETVEQAFIQSTSATEYTTSAFEEIYMSVSNLEQGFNGLKEQASTLQDSAASARIQVQTTKDNVARLSVAANEINEVTNSISDIASMTQLLALNASIEAARAGESGRGFAVVADEVKKLANQTDKATRQIASIANGILGSGQESSESIGIIDELTNEINVTIQTVFSDIENQWSNAQQLLDKVGQAAGTVSGLKGILMTADNQLKIHFLSLDDIFKSAKESSKSIKKLSARLDIQFSGAKQ